VSTANGNDKQDPQAKDPSEQPRKSAAAAASRARRIGGRVGSGTPAAGTAPERSSAAPGQAQPAPVSTTKRPQPTADRADTAPGQPVVLPGWLRWAPAGALSAGAITMAILLIVFSHGVWWARASAQSVREQVLAAAKTCIVDTNSYKYTALDAYETKALACATGVFQGQLRDTIEKLVKKNAPKLKAQQTTEINSNSAGIESITNDGKQWTVLLFCQLKVTNSNYPNGRTDPFGAQVTMEKVNGKWLIAKLATVSRPLG
jgi:hypothetical protein